MNWLLLINDTKCKQELQKFLRKNAASILYKTDTEKIIKNIEQVISGPKNKPVCDLISINSSSHTIVIKIKDIIHCQSHQNYTQIYLVKGKTITTTKTLKQFETTFSHQLFARIHQSHLVNIRHIDKYVKNEGRLVLTDGTELPVATRKKEYLLNVLDKL